MNATIYDVNGEPITEGLRCSAVCDEAIISARDIAADREQPVVLRDDDGWWLISPDGTATEKTTKELGFVDEEPTNLEGDAAYELAKENAERRLRRGYEMADDDYERRRDEDEEDAR